MDASARHLSRDHRSSAVFACIGGTTASTSGYDTSCNTDADCVGVPDGDVCMCECISAAVNQREASRYDDQVKSAKSHCGCGQSATCECERVTASCMAGTCVVTPTQAPSRDAGVTGGGTTMDASSPEDAASADATASDAGGDGAPPPLGANCIRFEACIDGRDDVSVASSSLSLFHIANNQPGTHSSCSGTTSIVDGGASLYEADGGVVVIDGVAIPLAALPAAVKISQIASIVPFSARGPVTLDGGVVDLDDQSFVAAAPYRVDLCQ